MEKKEMKWYESPAMEIVDIKLQGMLCASIEQPITAPEFGLDEE